VADLAGLDQLAQRGQRLFDRHAGAFRFGSKLFAPKIGRLRLGQWSWYRSI
jgi:hypothetical protein